MLNKSLDDLLSFLEIFCEKLLKTFNMKLEIKINVTYHMLLSDVKATSACFLVLLPLEFHFIALALNCCVCAWPSFL